MKIICVGRNYSAHVKELGNPIPDKPIIFIKPRSALIGPGKPVFYPEFTDDLQYECELVIKFDKNGRYISEKAACHYYSQVSLGIDFTARDIQEEHKKKGLPWELAKAFDGSAVIGKFIPLADLKPVQDLNFQMYKNNELVQDGFTAQMLNKVDQLISFISEYMMINIGDYLFTGTPSGVGQANVYDVFSGVLEGQEVFNISIK